MAEAFSDYLSFMPHASAKTVHKSIAKLLKDLEKQPADQLFFAQKAEELIHSDTSEVFSDELFLPFARAVVENKRIPAKDKTHFIDQTKILTATMLGSRMPDIAYTDRNGNKAVFSPDSTQVTILFFNEPDNHECLLAKARLNADSKSSSFIADGIMKIVAITKTEPGEDWISFAKTMPETWTVGAVPDIDKIYDIPYNPRILCDRPRRKHTAQKREYKPDYINHFQPLSQMGKLNEIIASTFVRCTGYTYSNMARLFIRLFVGVMFMQFGIRHLVNYEAMANTFPTILGWSSQTCLILMIVIEIVCSLLIMTGFLTRIATIPPIISMVAAEYYILHDLVPHTSVYGLDSVQPGYLPIMFIGIYLFILLAGPGKISLDYFISIFYEADTAKTRAKNLRKYNILTDEYSGTDIRRR